MTSDAKLPFFEEETRIKLKKFKKKSLSTEPLTGVRDIPPEQVAKIKHVEGEVRTVFEAYGYAEVITPVIERYRMYSERSGDSIRQQIYLFEDKGGRTICLRPEFTASIARAYCNKWSMLPKPMRLYYIGQAFRYERPQEGRYREFWHAGIELIDCKNPVSDAEIISIALDCVKKLKLKNFKVFIGHLGFLHEIFENEKTESFVRERIINLLDEIKERKIEKISEELGYAGVKIEDVKNILDVIEKLLNINGKPNAKTLGKIEKILVKENLSTRLLQDLKNTLNYLGNFQDLDDINIIIDLGRTRGLAYYTGIVFEIESPLLGAQKQICGGGRYDKLMGIFMEKSVPSLGFAFGLDRLLLALERENILEEPLLSPEFYVIPVTQNELSYACTVSQSLREKGLNTELNTSGRRVKNALAYANRKGIKYTVILGEKELKLNKITLRNMSTGEEKTIPIDEVNKFI